MASTGSQKKAISFSIDSILNSTSSRETKQQPGTMYSPSSEAIVTFPVITCSGSADIPIMPLIVPEFSDLRTDDQLSECSEVSDKPSNRASPSLSLNDSSFLSQENRVDYTPQSSRGRRKKSRTAFTSEQIDGLEKSYSQQRYLSVSERSDLAVELELSDQQVKTWFQNRRMKEKRQRRSAGNTAPPALPHLPSGGAVLGGSIMYHPDLTSQTMAMGFPAMSQNQVLASNLPYAEMYSFPMGYYPVPLSQLRACY